MSRRIMCEERKRLDNELNRAGNEKRGMEKIVGINPTPEEQIELARLRSVYTDKLRATQEHDAAISTSKCGCVL